LASKQASAAWNVPPSAAGRGQVLEHRAFTASSGGVLLGAAEQGGQRHVDVV
jgi:hypothetical protein